MQDLSFVYVTLEELAHNPGSFSPSAAAGVAYHALSALRQLDHEYQELRHRMDGLEK